MLYHEKSGIPESSFSQGMLSRSKRVLAVKSQDERKKKKKFKKFEWF
jgi:hypothetical protein